MFGKNKNKKKQKEKKGITPLTPLSPEQIKKGLILSTVIIIAQITFTYFFGFRRPVSFSTNADIPFLTIWALIVTIGLSIIGFSKFAKINISRLYFKKEAILGDIIRIFLIAPLLFAIKFGVGTLISMVLSKYEQTFVSPYLTTPPDSLFPVPLIFALNAIILIIPEEIVFRGFLHQFFTQKLGNFFGNTVQALLSTLTRVGLFFSAGWYIIIIFFITNLYYGFIKRKRTTILTSTVIRTFLD